MPFPYLVPIKGWIKTILEERESNTNAMTVKMPYAVLTSTAFVVKGNAIKDTDARITELRSIINGAAGTTTYNGCIISNKTDIPSNYQLKETILGYDFNGNAIKVENETNRRVSTPIIESVEIDTDGANNTLKTARINVKCFTLKQLEMFEVFFLRPGMNLMIEYGDSILLRNKNSDYLKPNEALSKKSSYDEFVKTFAKYSSADNETIKTYFKRVEKSKGTYDYVAGKLTDFSYSIEDNGIYNISLEISQGNQFTLAIPHNVGKSNLQSAIPPANLSPSEIFKQAKLQMCYDLGLDSAKLDDMLKNGNWQNEFFNWGKLNVKQEDETVSIKEYISARFIFKILVNYSVNGNTEFEFPIEKYKIGSKEEECIPVRSHKNLISSSEVILFPGSIYTLRVDGKGNTAKITLSDKTKDCKINGYSFNLSDKIFRTDENGTQIEIKFDSENQKYLVGNALNCFILYSEVVQIWKKSYTRLDFIEQIIKLINDNGYGLFDLKNASEKEYKKLSIIDFKLGAKDKQKIETNEVYRFKPTTLKSIVRNFTFNMELSNLVAGRTLFNTQKFIADSIVQKEKGINSTDFGKLLEEKAYQSVDMSQYTTYDGYYSIDKVSLQSFLDNKGKLIKQYEDGVVKPPNNDDTSKTQTTTKEESLQSLLMSKTKNFKLTNSNSEKLPLVFVDKELIQGYLSKEISENIKTKSILTPIEVALTIDGLSGFSCGEYFHIDGVPETYNRDGVFQITNIKHSINNDGWLTTIEAGWRIIN